MIKGRENGQVVFPEREAFQIHTYETDKFDDRKGTSVSRSVRAENDDDKGKGVAGNAVNEHVFCGIHLVNQGKQEV
jgi:hypothetical protein